jgi:hypothetical protein
MTAISTSRDGCNSLLQLWCGWCATAIAQAPTDALLMVGWLGKARHRQQQWHACQANGVTAIGSNSACQSQPSMHVNRSVRCTSQLEGWANAMLQQHLSGSTSIQQVQQTMSTRQRNRTACNKQLSVSITVTGGAPGSGNK